MDNERLQHSKPYPLGDPLNGEERRRFGLEGTGARGEWNIMAVWNGQPRRLPKKGEWYLSGAIITAYRAPNDLPTAYHIARLVKVEKRTTTVIVDAAEEA